MVDDAVTAVWPELVDNSKYFSQWMTLFVGGMLEDHRAAHASNVAPCMTRKKKKKKFQ